MGMAASFCPGRAVEQGPQVIGTSRADGEGLQVVSLPAFQPRGRTPARAGRRCRDSAPEMAPGRRRWQWAERGRRGTCPWLRVMGYLPRPSPGEVGMGSCRISSAEQATPRGRRAAHREHLPSHRGPGGCRARSSRRAPGHLRCGSHPAPPRHLPGRRRHRGSGRPRSPGALLSRFIPAPQRSPSTSRSVT